jgi:hypothetical protein
MNVADVAAARDMRHLLLSLFICVLCLAGAVSGEEACSSEFKLLLVPSDLQRALKSLDAGQGTQGEVYLFDTDALDLFSQGVILRVREGGAKSDLMVKVRVPTIETITGMGDVGKRYKCEIDQSGDSAVRSYSVLTRFAGEVPTSGNALSKLLSAGQRRLLEQAHVRINWDAVRRTANITSTVWQIRSNPTLPKLTLELWHWHTGQALEISAKAASAADSKAVPLRKLVADKGLTTDATQTQKTELVLREIRKISSQ